MITLSTEDLKDMPSSSFCVFFANCGEYIKKIIKECSSPYDLLANHKDGGVCYGILHRMGVTLPNIVGKNILVTSDAEIIASNVENFNVYGGKCKFRLEEVKKMYFVNNSRIYGVATNVGHIASHDGAFAQISTNTVDKVEVGDKCLTCIEAKSVKLATASGGTLIVSAEVEEAKAFEKGVCVVNPTSTSFGWKLRQDW